MQNFLLQWEENSSSWNIITALTLYHKIQVLTTLKNKAFENIVGKGENAGNQQVMLWRLSHRKPTQQ